MRQGSSELLLKEEERLQTAERRTRRPFSRLPPSPDAVKARRYGLLTDCRNTLMHCRCTGLTRCAQGYGTWLHGRSLPYARGISQDISTNEVSRQVCPSGPVLHVSRDIVNPQRSRERLAGGVRRRRRFRTVYDGARTTSTSCAHRPTVRNETHCRAADALWPFHFRKMAQHAHHTTDGLHFRRGRERRLPVPSWGSTSRPRV